MKEKQEVITSYQKKIKRGKLWRVISLFLLLTACLSGVVAMTLVIIGVLGNVDKNIFAIILLYGLILILIAVIACISYGLVTSCQRYNNAINRLNSLITRYDIMNDNTRDNSNLDRDLQLISRLLESGRINNTES